MNAKDVKPSRIEAAKVAAKSFVDQLPAETNVGLVSFAGSAAVLVSPGTDRSSIIQAIDNLRTLEATATGEAIFASLQSIEAFRRSIKFAGDAPPEGGRIVLMSDGALTVPRIGGESDPRGSFTAAREAAHQNVPVDTISFGTNYGSISLDGQEQPVPVDDASMEVIAQLSGGKFATAGSLEELQKAYTALVGEVGYETKIRDRSYPWFVGGILAVALALAFGLLANRRIP